MPAHLPDDLLMRGAGEAARLIALRHLDDAVRAQARLERSDDPDALHDFRVALRRLRSGLRSYGPYIEPNIGSRLRDRLRRVADTSGASRDLEVHAQWLTNLLPELSVTEAAAAQRVIERLQERKADADRRLWRRLRRTFTKTPARLQARLASYRVRLSLDEPARELAAQMIAREVAKLSERLVHALSEIAGADDVDAAHQARIAAKHLRYALEPATHGVAGAAELVESLRALQDGLGELHDAHMLSRELRQLEPDDLGADAQTSGRGAERLTPTAEVGLTALGQRLRERVRRTFDGVESAWLDGAAEEFGRRIIAISTMLAEQALPREIERKYLLRALPPRTAGAPIIEIEQGWLPGSQIIERLRRVRSVDDESELYYRTIKLGEGLSRVEVEERIDAALFGALWPLTEQRRIAKRRYRISDADAALTWEIDEFPDHDLVVAEVELPSADAELEPPDWLASYIVRDVTGDAAYTNYSLSSGRH